MAILGVTNGDFWIFKIQLTLMYFLLGVWKN